MMSKERADTDTFAAVHNVAVEYFTSIFIFLAGELHEVVVDVSADRRDAGDAYYDFLPMKHALVVLVPSAEPDFSH